MLKDSGAIRLHFDVSEIPPKLPLICLIPGLADAGSCSDQVAQHLFQELNFRKFASFKNDMFFDYRAHRPDILYNQGKLEGYNSPKLHLVLMKDEVGASFLLLSGYEPDFAWDRFTAEVRHLMSELDVSEFVWLQAIPFPVAHTRQIGVAVSGSDSEVVERYSDWKPKTYIPTTVSTLLEMRLIKSGQSSTGIALLVPYYLADMNLPHVPLRALEMLTAITGLVFPTDSLRGMVPEYDQKIESQVGSNPERQKMIAALEKGAVGPNLGPIRNPIRDLNPMLTSADEIAAELERYLANVAAQDSNPHDDDTS